MRFEVIERAGQRDSHRDEEADRIEKSAFTIRRIGVGRMDVDMETNGAALFG